MAIIVGPGPRYRFRLDLTEMLKQARNEMETLQDDEKYWLYVASVWENLGEANQQDAAMHNVTATRQKMMMLTDQIERQEKALAYVNDELGAE